MKQTKQFNFSREFKVWSLEHDDHLNLTLVESEGDSLEELIENARITLEDWHGNEGPAWTFGDLSTRDYDAVVHLMREMVEGRAE
jgi:hypothetical protein